MIDMFYITVLVLCPRRVVCFMPTLSLSPPVSLVPASFDPDFGPYYSTIKSVCVYHRIMCLCFRLAAACNADNIPNMAKAPALEHSKHQTYAETNRTREISLNETRVAVVVVGYHPSNGSLFPKQLPSSYKRPSNTSSSSRSNVAHNAQLSTFAHRQMTTTTVRSLCADCESSTFESFVRLRVFMTTYN